MSIKVLGQEATDAVIKQIKKRGKKKVNPQSTYKKWDIYHLNQGRAAQVQNGKPVYIAGRQYLWKDLDQSTLNFIQHTYLDRTINHEQHKVLSMVFLPESRRYVIPIPIYRIKISYNGFHNQYHLTRKKKKYSWNGGTSDNTHDQLVTLTTKLKAIMNRRADIKRIDIKMGPDWEYGKNFNLVVYY